MFNYEKAFLEIKTNCLSGTATGIDAIMDTLSTADLPTTRAVDFFLGLVEHQAGTDRIEYYLFNGTQIQRNYCTLYFARRNDWKPVNKAYKRGLIDAIQAYSR
ncbi:MAG: hypothetical protein JEZ04_13615 [Spirochaetales bacterium]|nr:hypothetical protein [Spirochaetales bacterium]